MEAGTNEVALRRQLSARFVGEQLPGSIAHLILIALAAVVLRGLVPSDILVLWVAAVCAATAARVFVYATAKRRHADDLGTAAPVTRTVIALTGLAWGIGAAILMPHLSLEYVALLLLILGGLVAGGVATLAADQVAFPLFLVGALAPLPVGVLTHGHGRFELASVFVIVVFGAFVTMMHRRTLRILVLQLQAEAAMREARDLAEHAAEARVAFLANMSHEIRTPMNAILGLTELLLDSGLPSEQHRSLAMVRSAADALLALLNDILDFSKIDADQLTFESVPFDIRYLLESTTSLLAVRSAGRPVELVADLSADLPPLVVGDPTRLRQVLTNLIGNAIKFTSAGEVVITAATVSTSDGSALIRFSVRDTGIGIPQAQLSRIFDAFTQADVSTTRRYGGTGLGLAIAKKIVKLMGGDLTVISEEGRGSQFTFTLRFGVDGAAIHPAVLAAGVLAGKRMLVVDDNANNRRIVREILAGAGVAVDESPGADDGLLALQRSQAAGHPYSLAIVDGHMPDRDGFDLGRAIRGDAAFTNTRLLMLTSANQRGDAEQCRKIGIEGYLTKPVSRTDLLEMVAALLGPGGRAARVPVLTRHAIAEARRTLRVLLVEDNAINQEVAAAILRKRGHIVDIAGTGREAVNAVARQTYDVVLMDIQMPEMDGFEATRTIRATPTGATLRIIALTAHALRGERERCIAQGMSGYLAKPFRPHDLVAAVEGFEEATTPAPPPAIRTVATPSSPPVMPPTATLTTAPAADSAAPDGPAEASPKAVDIEAFRRSMREAGAEGAVGGILETFVRTVPERLNTLIVSVAARDATATARAAHALQSPVGAIGALHLVDLLRDLEQAAQKGTLAHADASLEEVRVQTEAVLECVREESGHVPAYHS